MVKTLADSRDRLKLSKLSAQAQLVSTDIDLKELKLFTPKLPEYRIEEAVVAGSVNRTIVGASTVQLTLNDRYGFIKNSGRLGNKVDIKIDGLWFRLVKVQKSGFQLTLTFESREVAILRTYMKFKATAWGAVSRARFVQMLVNEVREFDIPFVCPELTFTKGEKRTAQVKAELREPGVSGMIYAIERARLNHQPITIKGAAPTTTQLRNIDTVLETADNFLGAGGQGTKKRKFMVCAIMTGITEATCHNNPWGDHNGKSTKGESEEARAAGSVGFFQQMPGWGTLSQRMDLTYSTKKFLEAAQQAEKDTPGREYGKLCQDVQVSAYPGRYSRYRVEAERIVTMWGLAGDDNSTDADVANANNQKPLIGLDGKDILTTTGIDKHQFMRGRPKEKKKPREKEDSWTCMQRLADEVDWRCFECSGMIYFISEPRLFRSGPRVRLNEESEGVDWIDYDYDVGKANASLTLTVRLDRWAAAPGTVIEIHAGGVSNGRWIVNDIDRDLFENKATVTLKKPRPKLPEPKKSQIATIATAGAVYQKKQPENYVPDSGGSPFAPLPTDPPQGKAIREVIVNHPNMRLGEIHKNDIMNGLMKRNILVFMWAFMEAGFSILIWSTRSDHSVKTNSGNISLHSKGLAVDMGNYNNNNRKQSRRAQRWIRDNAVALHIDELIGPVRDVLHGGPYSEATLDDHNDHIHVGCFP